MEFQLTFNWLAGSSIETHNLEDAMEAMKTVAAMLANLDKGETITVERLS